METFDLSTVKSWPKTPKMDEYYAESVRATGRAHRTPDASVFDTGISPLASPALTVPETAGFADALPFDTPAATVAGQSSGVPQSQPGSTVFSFVEEGKRVAHGGKQQDIYWDTVTMNGKQFLVERGDLEQDLMTEKDLAGMGESGTAAVVGKARCSLCCHRFAADSLSGVISMKRVMDLRKKWGMEQQGKRFSAASYRYSKATLCLFCSQFFTSEDGDHIVWKDPSTNRRKAQPLEEIIAEDLSHRTKTTKIQYDANHEHNLARVAKVFQSSVVNGQGPSVAVDGRLGNCLAEACCQTRLEQEPWFEVVLSSVETLATIHLHNRRDEGSSLTYRLCPFWILLAYVPISNRPLHEAKKMSHQFIRVTKHEDVNSWELDPPMRAAVVRIQAEGLKSLQLAQIVVSKTSDKAKPPTRAMNRTRSPNQWAIKKSISAKATAGPGTSRTQMKNGNSGVTGTFFLTEIQDSTLDQGEGGRFTSRPKITSRMGTLNVDTARKTKPKAKPKMAATDSSACRPQSRSKAKVKNSRSVDDLFRVTAQGYIDKEQLEAKLKRHVDIFSTPEEVTALEKLFIHIYNAEQHEDEEFTQIAAPTVVHHVPMALFRRDRENTSATHTENNTPKPLPTAQPMAHKRMSRFLSSQTQATGAGTSKAKLNLDIEDDDMDEAVDRRLLGEAEISGSQLYPVFRQLNIGFQTKKKKKAEYLNVLYAAQTFRQIFTSGVVDTLEEKLSNFSWQYFGKEGLPKIKWSDFLIFVRALREQKWRLLAKVFHVNHRVAPSTGADPAGQDEETVALGLQNSRSHGRLPDVSPTKRLSSTAPAGLTNQESSPQTWSLTTSKGGWGNRPATVGASKMDTVNIFLNSMEKKGVLPGMGKTKTERNLQKLMAAFYLEEDANLGQEKAFSYRNKLENRRKRQQRLHAAVPEADVMPRTFHKRCGLCHLSFAGVSFPASVSLKVLSNLFRRWNSESQLKGFETKLKGTLSQYHRIPLCTFCSQFIDPDQPDGLAKCRDKGSISGYVPFYDDRYPHAVGILQHQDSKQSRK